MLKASAFLFLLGAFCMKVHAQRSFDIENYTTKNGLPQNSVLSLEFDVYGYLWFSTEAGIVRFDGKDMRVFNVRSNPEFIADRGLYMLKTIKGEVIVQSHTAGPFSFIQGKMKPLGKVYQNGETVYRSKGGLPSVNLHERMVRESTIEKTITNGFQEYVDIYPLSDSSFLITDIDKVHRFQGTTLMKTYYTGIYKPAGYFMVNKQLLFVDNRLNLYKIHLENGKVTPCKLTGPLSKMPLNTVTFHNLFQSHLPFDDAYLITREELYRISATQDSNLFKSELITSQLPKGCNINGLAFDAAGSTFAIATDSKGLFLFRQQFIKTVQYEAMDELGNNVYYQQIAIDSSRILTNNDRLFDTRSDRIQIPDLGPIDGYAFLKDDSGNIWYSSRGKIIRYQVAEKKQVPVYGEVYGAVTALYEENNRIWVGSQNALAYISNDSMVYLLKQNSNPIYCFYELPGRGIMTGHNNGAFFLDPESLQPNPIPALYGICVRAIEDINGLLFIGTYGNGFYLWRNDTLIKAPLDRNFDMLNVHAFIEDEQGYIWMTTNHGLFVTTLSSLQAYFSDTTQAVYYYRYGLKDGIVNDEFNGGCSPAYVRLPNGLVSLPTMDGLVWFKPTEVAAMICDQSILVDDIRVDGKNYSVSELIVLPSNYRHLEINFSTPYLGINENLWMDYKIEGNHKHWIPLNNNERRIFISHMPFGDYSLLIRKRSGFGAEDWVQISLPFRVTPHFYQTWWFISLVMLVLSGLFWLAIRIYSRNIIKKNQRLEQLIDQRTVELQFANVQLAASWNDLKESVNVKEKLISILSHDIITPLRFIGLSAKLSRKQNQDHADLLSQTLGDIQNATAKLYDNASNMLNWINLQNHRIEAHPSYVAVFSLVDQLLNNQSEQANRKEILLVNDVSEDYILFTDKNLLNIVLSNVVTNAVKHTSKGTIHITATEDINAYKLTVTDNGNGIPEEVLARINSPTGERLLKSGSGESDFGGSGLGYLLIRDLLPIINGKYEVISQIGKGTTVIITLEAIRK